MTREEHEQLLRQIASESVKDVSRIAKTLLKDTMLADDLAQDILIYILTYPNDAIIKAYQKKQHIYFITKMINNQVKSKTSKFYYEYKKDIADDIDDYNISNDYTIKEHIAESFLDYLKPEYQNITNANEKD